MEYYATHYIPRRAFVSTSADGFQWDAARELPATDVAILKLNREARFTRISLEGKSTRRQPAERAVTFPNAPGVAAAPATKPAP